MKDIDLRELGAFAAVARHRSFRKAATERRVSVSTLSQGLRDLEERLGVRLLNRTTRSVAPTEAGERLLTRLRPALQDVFDAVDDIQNLRDVPAGRLRINAPAPAVHLVLAPMMAPFLKLHPLVKVEIIEESALIDVVGGGYDAGVRFEEHLAQNMIALSLGPPQRYAVVATPAFIRAHRRPKEPKDLLGQPCILTRFANGTTLPWEFGKARRTVNIEPEGPIAGSNAALLLRATLDGLGFLMTFEGMVREDIASGRLETVLEDWCPSFPGPFLYYPGRRQPPPALAAFISFVKEWRRRPAEARATSATRSR
jgi:DNA-binding transcriptional LysR family regulator